MLENDNISRIKTLLKAYPKGLTITDISSKLKMNRNTAAKYLEILLISGQLETHSYGTAHVFFLTHRIPISALLSISSDLVVALDETRKVVFCNDSFLTFFGIARDHIIGHHIVEIYSQGFQDITFSDLFADIIVNPDITREIPINKPTGNYFFRIKSIKTVFDDGSLGITVVMENVTAQRQAQEALKESEARFRAIFEKSQDGIMLYSADQHMDPNQRECNQQTLTLFGYASREEFITVHPADLSPAFQPNGQDSLSAANTHLKNVIEKGEERFEWVHKKKDGTTFPADVSLSAFELEGKTVILTSVRDITDRKHAEAALIKSEKKRAEDALRNGENYLLTIFNSAQSGLVVIDPETHTVFDANSTAVELIGTEKSNIVGSSCKKLFCLAENDQCPVTDLGQKLIRSESCLFNAKGEKKPVLKTVVPVQLGGHSYLLESFLDITERKRAEEALRESEDKYRTLVERANDGICVIQDGIVKFCNSQTSKFWAGSIEEILGRSFQEFIHPDAMPEVMDWYNQRMRGESPSSIYNTILRRKDGSRFFAEVNAGIILYDGRPGDLIILRDINDRKKAEEALRVSEGKLHAMMQSIADPMSMMDKDLTITWANEATQRYFGKDIIGRKCFEVYHQRQNPCEPYPCITLKAFQDDAVHRHETTVIDKHGQKKFFECAANIALRDESGKPVAVLEISRDITERKQAEAALKGSEKKFRNLTKMLPVEKLVPADVAVAAPGLQPTAGIAASECCSPVSPEIMNLLNLSNALKKAQAGITILDLSAHCVWANDALVAMLGVGSSDAIVGKSVAQYIASELRKPVLDMFSDVKKKHGHALFPISLMTNEGRVPVEASVSVVADDSGTPVGYLAIIRHMNDNAPEGMGGKTDPNNPSIPKKRGSLKRNIISSEKTIALFFTVIYILYHVFDSITCCP